MKESGLVLDWTKPSIKNDSILEEKSMSKLLINEAPIMIIPSLAVKISLNETIVLQQIHYWLQSSSHVIEGRKWIYNTYQDWQEQMPFWSKDTIYRAIRSLEKQGLLLTGNWNKKKSDNTKWYSINYQNLDALEGLDSEEHAQPSQHVESHGNSDTSQIKRRLYRRRLQESHRPKDKRMAS
jgi:DNA-binding PadR family transcriptional regulator